MYIRALPRVVPFGATTANARPVKWKVTDAPRRVAYLVRPPEAEAVRYTRQVPRYVTDVLLSW
jgi:hypothetical protein